MKFFKTIVCLLAVIFISAQTKFPSEPLPLEQCFELPDDSALSKLVNKNLKELLPDMVATPTVRSEELNTDDELKKIQKVKDLIDGQVENFNKSSENKLVSFEWKKEIDGKPFWVFGYRLGTGDKKVALITHVDVVPAGVEGAFELKCQNRIYEGKEQPFFVGRGALDNKGPTISTLSAVQALSKIISAKSLENLTIELVIDTSEEVELGAHHYFAERKSNSPDIGVVVDAAWCTVAEKGIERPIFSFPKDKKNPSEGLYIEDISVPEGNPVNVIPDFAEAVISSQDKKDLAELKKTIEKQYEDYDFGDPDYKKAKLSVLEDKNGMIVLRTVVSGAQHGSAPQENREHGANPLVSLLNFLAHLSKTKVLKANAYSNLAQFAQDTFGTTVFGENHPELLQKSDVLFKKGDSNGTTYAVTKVAGDGKNIQLFLDIRYGLKHQQCGWDNKTYGTLKGKSVFRDVFEDLVNDFKKSKSIDMSVETRTAAAPDLKDTTNEAFEKINKAFKKVMKKDCPQKAIGGATDSKGESALITAGALFDFKFGYPTYYHGKSEGVPVNDLYKTSEILLEFLKEEAGVPKAKKRKTVIRQH